MLTAEDNELFTRVGPGTAGGDLLRRYWHPVCMTNELTPEKATRRVTLLGEQLVVYRDRRGVYGLVAERCPHRGASLYYGYVEEDGIRCAYHGWLFSEEGRCLEQPFELKQETTSDAFRHPAYPVQELGGLLFAYLGPQPAPLLPKWDVLAREDGNRTVEAHELLNCNWLQCQENSLDPAHTYYLHLRRMVEKGKFRGRELRAPERYLFQEHPFGIVKRRIFGGDGKLQWEQLGHPAIFPNILRHATERPSANGGPTPEEASAWPIDLQIRVPIDDTHTQIYIIYFTPTPDGTLDDVREEPNFARLSVRDESGDFHLETFPSQDEMAWETQGPIADRTIERLGVSDMGIAIWRRLLHEQIQIVQDGGDPMCVFRSHDGVIDVGPSREWNGERYVPKRWEGWGDGKVWTTPNVWLGHEAAAAS